MALQKTVDKWKMKKWFQVYAPKAFNDAMIGEMPANEDVAAMDRNITVSLDSLTKNPQHANTNVVLRVADVSGTTAKTRFVRMELIYSYIRSIVRRYKSVSSAVIPVTTKDGTPIVVKIIAITGARANHSKLVGIRKEMSDLIKAFASDNDLDTLIAAVVEGKLQALLNSKLRHISQLSRVEIKKLEVATAG
ncbi:MAG: hypothetical protein KGH98_02610 [Candidatus Micrarchaeota archaeon]|nr:hypothetical protein [Candidatus Micrarchaeota archaeon]